MQPRFYLLPMLMSFKLSSDSVLKVPKVSNDLKDIGKRVAVGHHL